MSAFSSLSEFWQTMLPFIMLVCLILNCGDCDKCGMFFCRADFYKVVFKNSHFISPP